MLPCVAIWLALLAVPAYCADEKPEYAAGAHKVLSHQPDLPQRGQTATALKEILVRPEFQVQPPPPPQQSLLDRILQWLSKHFPSMSGLVATGNTVAIVTVLVVVVLVALLLYAIVRMMWWKLSQVSPTSFEVDEAKLDAAGLLELAKRAAAAGDYRTALRLRFRAVVSKLGVLDADWQTNWQLLNLVRREHPEASRNFAKLIALFEDCWYGGVAAGQAEYERADDLAQKIELVMVVREAAA